MKNLKIGQKIILILGLVLVVFTGMSIYTINEMKHLSKMQDEGAIRAEDAVIMQEGGAMGHKLYLVIADAEINKDLKASAEEWEKVKTETENDFATMDTIVDTDRERVWFNEAKQEKDKLISLYENDMLPLLKAEVDSAIEAKIREIDAEIDAKVKSMEKPLIQIVGSIHDESTAADGVYDDTSVSVRNLIVFLLILVVLISRMNRSLLQL